MSVQTVEIAQATLGDLDRLVPLFEAHRIFHGRKASPDATREFVSSCIDQPESVVFLAQMEDLIGFVRLYPTLSSLSLGRQWTVADLFIAEVARRRGVARLLLGKAYQHAIGTGARTLLLQVRVDNWSARQVYEKGGWEQDREYCTYVLEIGP